MRRNTANPGEWFTSSYSSGNGQCVQVRRQEESIGVRDSVHPKRALLDFPKEEWQSFVNSTKDS
ncbi:DUF397 domain-containing protein [Nocardiopsis algeriensis]|uniref:DUF397 domain-containing protein n=1 Tax=Nocardiopsis algeriensis TaxID=1478215 RepID=A0A841IV76_9ACTN|nr:DUF397 domain-containing protein [Nocardiopsis algeriensis]MBB6122234.1 hypothetical protein [Nocardiopsis algeriensis]